MDADGPTGREEEAESGGRSASGSETHRAGRDLRNAMRAARIDDAERSRAIDDLRGAEIARLELLRDAIIPVLAAVPGHVEMFDAGLIPVPQPRLFIDMVAFVEMARDRRRYRFVQDTRQGRVVIAESERLDAMRDAVTAYVARRLVEREKALAPNGPARETREPRAWRPVLRRWGDVALSYLGVVSLVVLAWVLGHAVFVTLVGVRP